MNELKGEKILCLFRKMMGPFVIAGAGRHRQQRAMIWGLPARCIAEKEWKFRK
ncbi:MAG: hypothetical protein ISS48_04260 [Candidatus Aenigmarchaeota archaeon]|nr:hypothetical protein [Candidatus Aenigmarchaeota archaeon]